MQVPWQVRWHDASAADEALRADIVEVHGEGAVTTGRLCSHCGSSEHGSPWARHDGRDVSVSLSRSGPHLVTAVASYAVGIDVDSIADVATRWDPALVLAPGESAATDEEKALAWVRKEAILKAYGVGLARPMTDLVLADLSEWLIDLRAPEGYVAALAVRPNP